MYVGVCACMVRVHTNRIHTRVHTHRILFIEMKTFLVSKGIVKKNEKKIKKKKKKESPYSGRKYWPHIYLEKNYVSMHKN